MPNKISTRLKKIADALPLENNMRVIEIGCGPGVLSREILNKADNIFVLGIDLGKSNSTGKSRK